MDSSDIHNASVSLSGAVKYFTPMVVALNQAQEVFEVLQNATKHKDALVRDVEALKKSAEDFKAKEETDIFTTGFNTPKYSANVQFGNREIVKNFGFNVVWKWQDAYEWQSPLANGHVPAYQTFDAQITYKIEKANTLVKVGGTNIFNNRYIQYAAGPTIGGLYYVSLTFDAPFQNK
jgi:hypothetical protein